MARKPFDPSELVPVGQYGTSKTSYLRMHETPKYKRPVTPRENAILFFQHKKPYWMPSLDNEELISFRPRLHPDNVATRLVIDAEPPIEYESNIVKGWFGLEWEYVAQVNGATVHPGKPAVPDMSCWEDYISIPNLDELDWEHSSEANRAYLAESSRFKQVCCLTGLWERLISLMDVQNAAVALVDEEQQEGVHRFLSALCDMYEDMIERYARYFNLDLLLMHDDWGSQRAPFFSLDTCREMIVPYLKRVVDACHRNGLFFELHCCGQDELLVPAMIEAGVDLWRGQNMNDYEKLSDLYPDNGITFNIAIPKQPEDADEIQLREAAEDFFNKYKDRRVIIDRYMSDQRLIPLVYEISRNYYAQFDD